MEDFKNCILEFLKQQEYLKQEIQWQEDLKRLHENIDWFALLGFMAYQPL